MELAAALPLARIRAPLSAGSPLAAIEELLATLPFGDDLTRASARAAVLGREAEASTGIGGGVAIPHGRTERVDGSLCALGIAPAGIGWDAIDGAPCQIVLLCVSNSVQASRHLVLLGELAALLNDGTRRGRLAAACSPSEARSALVGI